MTCDGLREFPKAIYFHFSISDDEEVGRPTCTCVQCFVGMENQQEERDGKPLTFADIGIPAATKLEDGALGKVI